jgi:uncharacterized protein YndB with AHSA1/START domain
MPARPAHVRLDVEIDAPVDQVFAAITAWQDQGAWMLGTRVELREGDGASVGSVIAAWTGAGPFGFWDTMVITRWEPPYRVDVLHTGSLVRGTGTMEVQELPHHRSLFIWSEDLDLPLGALGRAGWPVAKAPFLAGVRASLAKFARLVEAGDLPIARR